jgi:beta-mannosidase
VALWCGDNECDGIWLLNRRGDPNRNLLTRQVLPRAVYEEDPQRPYMPSSPCYDPEAVRLQDGADYLGQYVPEGHVYPGGYFKDESILRMLGLCLFAGEIGHLGCPSAASLRRFLSPDRVWPWQGNLEWLLHSTNPTLDATLFIPADSRVKALADQMRGFFGQVPETMEEFIFASQAVQAEAYKFFIEYFRAGKWAKTGILWWNLIDGWPQLSDAVVDYYFGKKLAYHAIRRVQQPVAMLLTEPEGDEHRLMLANDTRDAVDVEYTVTDADTGECVLRGHGRTGANGHAVLGRIPHDAARARFYLIEWHGPTWSGRNHYLAGQPPFDLSRYRGWLVQAGYAVRSGKDEP